MTSLFILCPSIISFFTLENDYFLRLEIKQITTDYKNILISKGHKMASSSTEPAAVPYEPPPPYSVKAQAAGESRSIILA